MVITVLCDRLIHYILRRRGGPSVSDLCEDKAWVASLSRFRFYATYDDRGGALSHRAKIVAADRTVTYGAKTSPEQN